LDGLLSRAARRGDAGAGGPGPPPDRPRPTRGRAGGGGREALRGGDRGGRPFGEAPGAADGGAVRGSALPRGRPARGRRPRAHGRSRRSARAARPGSSAGDARGTPPPPEPAHLAPPRRRSGPGGRFVPDGRGRVRDQRARTLVGEMDPDAGAGDTMKSLTVATIEAIKGDITQQRLDAIVN